MSLALIAIAPGVDYFPGFLDRAAQEALREEVLAIIAEAPLFRPRMPRTGKPFSVMMTNCGPLGWVSDEGGYRYQTNHPETGRRWPPMPVTLIDAWRRSLRQPRRPKPVSSISTMPARAWACTRTATRTSAPLRSCRCRSATRRCSGSEAWRAAQPTRSFRLKSGDAMALGGPARLAFHGVDRIVAGSSTLLPGAAGST